jgi:hypothetical protein
MDTLVKLGENFPIYAYLSYRCKIDRDIQAREKLEETCGEHNITLKYDKNCTEQGDSLVDFMAELTSARCVYLFLSPEYFQSAYTLFELVNINEWAELDPSFILPLRLSETMVTYQWTAAKNYFDGNEAVRNELVRLFKKNNFNHENAWQRIDTAWNAIIFPHLDKLNVSLESANADVALGELLGKTKTAISEAINQSTKTLHNTLIDKIEAILSRKNINADDTFREKLKLSANNDTRKIATKLVTGKEVGEAIAILTRVIKEKKELLSINSSEWKPLFIDAEQLCGWLLINSVDSIWWFHNEIKLKKTAKTSISAKYTLNDPNYIEVVISRSLLQNARFVLDKNNQPKPANDEHDVLLFDALSSQATTEALLFGIYKDLYGTSPSSDIDILSKIVLRAKTHHKNEEGKLIYYLVSQDYLETLQRTPWYLEAQKQLAGYLQFICCGQPTNPNERPASAEDQAQLLDQVANLISLQH